METKTPHNTRPGAVAGKSGLLHGPVRQFDVPMSARKAQKAEAEPSRGI